MARAPGREERTERRVEKILGIPHDPHGETPAQRLERARAWVSSDSPKERRWALSILNQMVPDEALEPLLAGLNDPAKTVPDDGDGGPGSTETHPRRIAGRSWPGSVASSERRSASSSKGGERDRSVRLG